METNVWQVSYGFIVLVQRRNHHSKIIVRSPATTTHNKGRAIYAPATLPRGWVAMREHSLVGGVWGVVQFRIKAWQSIQICAEYKNMQTNCSYENQKWQEKYRLKRLCVTPIGVGLKQAVGLSCTTMLLITVCLKRSWLSASATAKWRVCTSALQLRNSPAKFTSSSLYILFIIKTNRALVYWKNS